MFMDDFERRVMEEIGRLEGPEFPRGRRAARQRVETIRALAEAAVAGEPWTGENGVLGPKRPVMIIGEKNFYEKKHWYAHPLTREVIESVIRLYMERDAAERERARLEKKAWLENKEFEAAEKQFRKADDLLSLPHIVKAKSGKGAEPQVILEPANAAVFNAAVNLNMKASDLARRSLGLPTETKRNELTGAEGGAIALRSDELNEVSDDELRRRVEALARGTLAVVGRESDQGGQGRTDGEMAGDAGGTEGDDPAGKA